MGEMERRKQRTPRIETVKLRRLLHDGTRLVSCLVDAPTHHADGDNGQGEGLDEEKRAKLARVKEAEGESTRGRSDEYSASARGQEGGKTYWKSQNKKKQSIDDESTPAEAGRVFLKLLN